MSFELFEIMGKLRVCHSVKVDLTIFGVISPLPKPQAQTSRFRARSDNQVPQSKPLSAHKKAQRFCRLRFQGDIPFKMAKNEKIRVHWTENKINYSILRLSISILPVLLLLRIHCCMLMVMLMISTFHIILLKFHISQLM